MILKNCKDHFAQTRFQERVLPLVTVVPHFSLRPHPTPRMVPQLASKTGIKDLLQKGSQKDSLVYFFLTLSNKAWKILHIKSTFVKSEQTT